MDDVNKHTQSIRQHTLLTELRRMLKSIGKGGAGRGYYGDLDGSALTVDSRMVVVKKWRKRSVISLLTPARANYIYFVLFR